MSQPGLGINPPSAQPNRVADPTNDVRYVAAASHAQLEDTHANVRNGESPLYDASSEKGVYAVERNEIVYQLVSDACAGMPRVASSLNNIGTAGMTREELKTLIEPMGVAVNHVTEEQIKKGKGKGIVTVSRGGLRTHPNETRMPIRTGDRLTFAPMDPTCDAPEPASKEFKRPNTKKRLVVEPLRPSTFTEELRADVWRQITDTEESAITRGKLSHVRTAKENAAMAVIDDALWKGAPLLHALIMKGILRPGALLGVDGRPVEAGSNVRLSNGSPVELYDFVEGSGVTRDNGAAFRPLITRPAQSMDDDGQLDAASQSAWIIVTRIMEALGAIEPSAASLLPLERQTVYAEARMQALTGMFSCFNPIDIMSHVGAMRRGRNLAVGSSGRVNNTTSIGRLRTMQMMAPDACLNAYGDAVVSQIKWDAGMCVTGAASGGNVYAA